MKSEIVFSFLSVSIGESLQTPKLADRMLPAAINYGAIHNYRHKRRGWGCISLNSFHCYSLSSKKDMECQKTFHLGNKLREKNEERT